MEAYSASAIKFEGVNPKPMMLRVTASSALRHAIRCSSTSSSSTMHTRAAEDDDPVAVVAALPRWPGGRAGVDLSGDGRLLPRSRPIYRQAIRAFADAGCRYLQLDEVNFAYLCDPKLRAAGRRSRRGSGRLPHIYAEMINAAISDIPADMTISMHLCRGNFRSTFVAAGGYEPVAEMLFNKIDVDGYFLEYDSERAGGFEPLRFVPKGKTVVLGLVTTKTGTLESKDELKRRIDEAAKFVPLDQLCLSPQCGFASTEEGNILAEEEQWAKLSASSTSRARCGGPRARSPAIGLRTAAAVHRECYPLLFGKPIGSGGGCSSALAGNGSGASASGWSSGKPRAPISALCCAVSSPKTLSSNRIQRHRATRRFHD